MAKNLQNTVFPPRNAYCHLLQISPDESHDMDQRTDW